MLFVCFFVSLFRCRIRDLLRQNGQLPDGIDTLRLPKRLQRYIDLMEEIEGPDNKSDDTKNIDKPTTSKKGKHVRIVVDDDKAKKETATTTATTTTTTSLVSESVAEKCNIKSSSSTPTIDSRSSSSDTDSGSYNITTEPDTDAVSARFAEIVLPSISISPADAIDNEPLVSDKDTTIATDSSSTSDIPIAVSVASSPNTTDITAASTSETTPTIDCIPKAEDETSASSDTSTTVVIDKPFSL